MSQQEHWKTKIGFIFAAAGSAIGLGAIWKFPTVAGTNGGAAFLIIFLAFTLLLGLPLLLGEFILGRNGQTDAISVYKKLAPKTNWSVIGKIGVAACFLLLSFYSVIGGWIILYLIKALSGGLGGIEAGGYEGLFGEMIANPYTTIAAQGAFMLMTIIVVAKGVQNGIEKASKIMMPALFILFLLLIIRSLTLPGAGEGVAFLFVPDFSMVTPETVLFALGQSFFTLSIGVSVMVTYASYLPKTQNLPGSALSILLMNILIVLLAGLAIFPGVFTFGLEPDAGPTLIFAVLPAVFAKLPFGMAFFVAFLVLFLFAALTSAFSMIEIIVATRKNSGPANRKKHTWIIGGLIFLVGIPSCLSYGVLADVTLFGKTIFDLADFLVSNVLMPLGAILIALFIPMKMPKKALFGEMAAGSKVGRGFFSAWYVLLKYVAPIAILIVFLDVTGALNWLKK